MPSAWRDQPGKGLIQCLLFWALFSVYSFSQVEHATKEEREFSEKYQRKWEQLDPHADNEKSRANEAKGVKETALKEVRR